jgi:hypothetical protein
MFMVGAAVNVWRGRSDGTDTRNITGTYALGSVAGSLNPSIYNTIYHERFNGTNIDVGVLAKPRDWLRVGAVVKNGFDVSRTFDYSRHYTNWVGGISAETYHETGTIDWPRSVGVGVAVFPSGALTLSTDYTGASWSSARYTFTTSDVQTINGAKTTTQTAGMVIYPEMYDPAKPVQPYFNVLQRDSSQLKAGGEFVWLKSRGGRFAGIPLRAGVYRNHSLLPQSNGSQRTGTGVTTGAGLRWRQLYLDVAYVREAISGKTAEFATTPFPGFSESQQEGGLERTVFHQLLLAVTAGF